MIWEVAPFPKPRMTQRDKWKKRPVVVKYILFKLQLWYDEGEVKPAELKSFIEKYESILHYKTTIRPWKNTCLAMQNILAY